MPAAPNAITLELFKNRFASICEEMGVTLRRTAFSPNIKERLDFSCALFDGEGQMVAQAAHIPVHLGSMPLTVQQTIRECPLADGDMVIVNDPYRGGTHLPDVTLVAPVFLGKGKRPEYYVANRAHHADIGGSAPGSMAPTRELFQEGLIIPPLRIMRQGEIARDVLDLVLSNLRGRTEREGDFAAQIAAARTGVSRIRQLVEQHGRTTVRRCAIALMDYAERVMRATIRSIPDGDYAFEDVMDAVGGVVPRIRVAVRIRGGRATLDFEGTSAQVDGNVNAVYAITTSAIVYVFSCLAPTDVPSNAGIARPLHIRAPEGSLVNAQFPAGVAGGNVETSQRIVDVVLGALAQACPDRIPAASSGTMTNLAFGTTRSDGGALTYYETVAGGMGAGPTRDGLDAVHTHMTNTLNTPIEAFEHAYPARIERYAIRRRSGGAGEHRGGDGIVRAMRFDAPATVSLLADRHESAPYGLQGGAPGKSGEAFLVRDGKRQRVAAKGVWELRAGDAIEVRTPGGGGWGAPKP